LVSSARRTMILPSSCTYTSRHTSRKTCIHPQLVRLQVDTNSQPKRNCHNWAAAVAHTEVDCNPRCARIGYSYAPAAFVKCCTLCYPMLFSGFISRCPVAQMSLLQAHQMVKLRP
jgi:hypothetical protein